MKNIILKANAKLNLFLDIVAKRADGYHELDSVMISIGIFDELIFERTDTPGISISCDKEGFPLDKSNIIYKAADALMKANGLDDKAGLNVTVKKNIPSQAGMGGGSADGAAALIAVDRLFELDTPMDKLTELGARIGADVPFCLKGGCQICRGIGEKLSETELEKELYFVVIKPQTAISTPKAYSDHDKLISPVHKNITPMISALKSGDTKAIAKSLFNAFEQTINDSEIDKAKEALKSSGAEGVLMTGSGSAVFGVFEKYENAERAYNKLKEKSLEVYICKSEKAGVQTI
ncbi:MAG: 4-(cytidine 5'-diphospho)-2-C-methyl-D-erythritol kinase [Ruminococcus sp.]|nr:4-(cytidine 5'-diphospho)-2-C-methyl-D-erythritol kinase [Ruminococcus sp.]